jgi:RNA polymerase sigma factor (sigma-70 family)
MVRGVCRRILDNLSDAEDAFQATFLVLFRSAGSLRVGSSLGPWLYGVARRVALRARADRVRRGVVEGRVGERAGQDPAADACRGEVQSIIDEEIGRLPERYRGPVILCLLEGLTYDEASRRLGCPIGTVGVQLSRAREMLRARLTRRGIAPTSAALALLPSADCAPVSAQLARAALDANRVPSPRIAELTRREIRAMFAMKARAVAVIASSAIVIAGGVAWIRSGPKAEEPGPNVVQVAEADPDPAPPALPEADVEVPADAGMLVDKQEEQLKRIRSLKCVIDLRISDDAGKTWKTMARCKVARSGPQERVHLQNFWIRDRDRVVRNNNLTDVLLSSDGILSIDGIRPGQSAPGARDADRSGSWRSAD